MQLINSFTAILFLICVFLIWMFYLCMKEKNETKKENKAIMQQKEKLQKTYETKSKEQKENEQLRKEMHSGTDNSFNASLELLHKYNKKDK